MGRFFIFIISVIGFGLLQLWAVATILFFENIQFDFIDLLKDGGLFFFSLSLAASHAFILAEGTSKNALNIIFTAVVLLVNFTVSLVVYSMKISSSIQFGTTPDFSGRATYAQLVCAVLAIIYAIYVQNRTGGFSVSNSTNAPFFLTRSR